MTVLTIFVCFDNFDNFWHIPYLYIRIQTLRTLCNTDALHVCMYVFAVASWMPPGSLQEASRRKKKTASIAPAPGLFKHSGIHSPAHSLNHTLIHPLTHSLTHPPAFIYSLTHSLTHSTTHSFTHSPTSIQKLT